MMRLLRWLFTGDGHAHKWETISHLEVHRGDKIIGHNYILRCEICGNIKNIKAHV